MVLKIRKSSFKHRRNRKSCKVYCRIDFWREVFGFHSEEEFKKRFRMSKNCFFLLYRLLRNDLSPNRSMSPKLSKMYIPGEVKLAMTIRYLAGGQIYDIADRYGYHSTTTNLMVWKVMGIILKTKLGRCEFKADDAEWLKEKANLYSGLRVTNPLAEKCVGCVDGLAIEIERPDSSFSPKEYSNRKGFYSITCQGICDAQHRFIFFDCSCPGSTHDSLALSRTSIFEKLTSGLLNSYWLAADAAYPLIGSIMKPFQGKSRVDIFEDSYNFHLSSIRVNIENTFGIFIQRWGIFWRSLRHNPADSTKIIHCCVRLHNFIIDTDGELASLRLLERSKEHKYFSYWQDEHHTTEGVSIPTHRIPMYGSMLRNMLVGRLRRLGIVRPT